MARTRGLHFNDSLARSKGFRNPRVHSTLVKMMNVDETTTNWDKGIWDPKGLNPEGTATKIGTFRSPLAPLSFCARSELCQTGSARYKIPVN